MNQDYKNIISHIDIDRSFGAIEYSSFNGIDDVNVSCFKEDFEEGNDSIELHLIKSRAYKEALILRLKKTNGAFSDAWGEFLHEEQKTFGGSKIFYIDDQCANLLVLAIPNEMKNKMNMVITRLNKINERITRINTKIRKENLDLYESKVRSKAAVDKKKDDIINFINQNLRV